MGDIWIEKMKLTEEQKQLCYKLRNETGLAIMYCKRCLIDNDWNYELAKASYKKYDQLHILKQN